MITIDNFSEGNFLSSVNNGTASIDTLTTMDNSYLYSDISMDNLNVTDKSNATFNIDKYAKRSNPRDFNQIKEAINEIQPSLHESNQGMLKWPKKTILVASDSMLSGLEEQRLRKYNHVTVRCFTGSTVKDMYHYLYPLLQKEPEYLVLHVGTNDCTYHTSDTVLKDLLSLKRHFEVTIPGIKVILSLPISRFDNNVTSRQKVSWLKLFMPR